LGNCDDFIADFHLLAPLSRAGHEAIDLALAVHGAEFGSDAEQGQIHLDGEVFEDTLAHVIGMGIVNVGEGVEVDF